MTKKEIVQEVKIEEYNISPCDVIFNHVQKPNNFLYCRSINVFDNRWRVNIYTKRYVEGIEGKCISASYFVKFNKENNKIDIIN